MGKYHFLVLGEEPRQKYLAAMLRRQGHVVMETEDYLPGYHDAVLLPVPQTAKYLVFTGRRIFRRRCPVIVRRWIWINC